MRLNNLLKRLLQGGQLPFDGWWLNAQNFLEARMSGFQHPLLLCLTVSIHGNALPLARESEEIRIRHLQYFC